MATTAPKLQVLRSLIKELRNSLQGHERVRHSPAFTYIMDNYRRNAVTDQQYCRQQEEMTHLAHTCATYPCRYQELHAEYQGRGERTMSSTPSFKMKMPGMMFVFLLAAAELLWSPVSSSISVLRLSNSTDYCTLANSHLSCDFTGVEEPVYAEEGYLENIDSVECRGPLVLHLPENACIKNMTIQHTKKVVVTGRSWKTSCNEYHLFVNNTTMTAIPFTTTHLHAVGSTCYKMKLHPKMKHVSVVSSRVSLLATDQFLNDSVVVNITNTTVHYVNSLSASKNAKIQFLASDIAYMRLDRTALQDNAALVMVNSRIRAGDNQELLVPPGVSVTLDRLDSKLQIRAIGIIPGSETSQSPESCNGINMKESTTHYFVQFVFFCTSTVFLILVVLFMGIKIMTTCLLKRSVRQIPDSVGHERQIKQNSNTLSEISLNELFEGNFLNESFLHDHEKTTEADEKKELEDPTEPACSTLLQASKRQVDV